METLAWLLGKNFMLDVYQFTLPGHGFKDKNLATYKEWIKSTDEKIETLINYGYNDIYVVGHSMGGILATYVASKYKQVKKVVLAAPAFKYIAEKENFSLKKTTSIINDYGFDEVANRFLKLPISALNEFVQFVKQYQNLPPKINIPILILQGTKDDIVPISSAEYVYDNVKTTNRNLVYLIDSNHDIFNGPKKEVANIKIEQFFMGNKAYNKKEYI